MKDNNGYLDFNEAVEVLKTTRSTLYKWLQAGKVPGHKLGRQWRFNREELIEFMEGDDSRRKLQDEVNQLGDFFDQRGDKPQQTGGKMGTHNVGEVAEKLIWDAARENVTDIHIQPSQNQYKIYHRNNQAVSEVTTLSKELFEGISNYWHQISSPTMNDNKRRFFLNASSEGDQGGLQVRYQQVDTVQGERVTLRVLRSSFSSQLTLAEIMPEISDYKRFMNWLSHESGIIVVAGPHGSGKTTALYCAVQELLKQNKVAFTMESPVEFVMEGVNQIEVDISDIKQLKETYNSISDSDPDILCLGLGRGEQDLTTLTDIATQGAASGCLVLLQLEASSAQKAMEDLKESAGQKLIDHLIGVSWQKLVKSPSGRGHVAKYEMIES